MKTTAKMSKKQRDRAARQLVKQVLGLSYSIKLLSRGDHNDVYLVSKGEDKFTLRLGHPDFSHAYHQAQQAMTAARQHSLPAPEVVLYGKSLVPRSYLLTRYAEGISGDKYKGDRLKLWQNIGELAEQINRIMTLGYGQHLFRLQKGEETWRRYIVPNINAQLDFYGAWRGFERGARKPFFRPEELAAIDRQLKPLISLRLKPRLIHVDLAPRNVLVDSNGQIICVIDWDSAKSFPRPHQVAVSSFWLSPEEEQAFVKGYGTRFDPKIIKAFQIFEFLTQIPYYHKQPRLAKTARQIIRHLINNPQPSSPDRPRLLVGPVKTQEA